MKVYLAGPMRGLPGFNFDQFHKWAERLRGQGHQVFSPAEQELSQKNAKIFANCKSGLEEDIGIDRRGSLGTDLAWICAEADAVALIPGWVRSRGAVAEKATAEALNLKVMYLGEDYA